jgi:hypothetical protein
MALTGKAILEINPNAKVHIVREDGSSEETITWLDGTPEISQADIDAKRQEIIARLANEEKAQKEADALAGNNKLLELGLTQAQVTAMTGYTPPAEV